MMRGERRRIELAYSLQFSLPGTPVLRYGEEIGMSENLALPGRDAIRTPDAVGRLARRPGSPAHRPPTSTGRSPPAGAYAPKRCNVRDQSRDRDSLLRWFEQLIRVLRECPEIGVGAATVLDLPLPRSVLAHRFDTSTGSVLLLHNLADQPVTVDVTAMRIGADAYQVFGDSSYEPLPRKVTELPLTGWGYRWIRLRGGF